VFIDIENANMRYVHTLNNMIEGVAIINRDWKYLYANDPYAKQMQMSCDDLIIRSLFDLGFDPVSDSHLINICKKVLSENIPDEIEIKYQFVDGSLHWFLVNVSLIPEGIFIQSLDITQIKLTEKSNQEMIQLLEYRTEELKAIIESIPDAIIIGNKNAITQCNSRALKLLGFDSEDLKENFTVLSKRINMRWPQNGIPLKFDEHPFVRAFKNENFEENIQITNVKSGKDLIIRVAGAPVILNGKIIGVVVIESDISVRLKIEEGLRRTLMELNHSNDELNQSTIKLKAYSERLEDQNENRIKLFSIIAHDLRSPFQVLASVANLLIEDLDSFNKEEIINLAHELRKTVDVQFEVVNNLLTWVQLQKGIIKLQLRRLFLFDKVKLVLEQLLHHSQNKNIQIINSIPKNIIAIGDQDMLQTVFQNIIYNGIKFSNPDGLIEIKAEKSGMEIITSIKDNGIGMEEDLQKLIFTINRNVKREGTLEEKGTGLGLNLCKEMVTKQGGRIWLESEEGKGSTFYFSLPAAEEEN
jgi:PAS domain S-box-containing protein